MNLGNIVKADSIAEVTDILKDSESKTTTTTSTRNAAATTNAATST